MSQRTEVLKDIPEADLPRVKAQYEAAGATVTATKQPNGLWTITAVFHDAEHVEPGKPWPR